MDSTPKTSAKIFRTFRRPSQPSQGVRPPQGRVDLGDKSPNYYDRLPEMAETFPDAKFIIVWRDPAGTANSILRAGRSGNHYFKRKGATLRGLIGYAEFKKGCDWLVTDGKPLYQLNYEDLTTNTAGIMQEVCRFLEIPYLDDLATLQGADRSAIFGGEHHSFVKGDKIVAGTRPSIVDDHFRNKIAQYVAYWRARYAGNWPPYPREGSHTKRAGLFTRMLDRLAYRRIRATDFITRVCFSFVSLSLLKAFRNRKYRRTRFAFVCFETAGAPQSQFSIEASRGQGNLMSALMRLRARASRTAFRAPLVWARHLGLDDRDVFLASYPGQVTRCCAFRLPKPSAVPRAPSKMCRGSSRRSVFKCMRVRFFRPVDA